MLVLHSEVLLHKLRQCSAFLGYFYNASTLYETVVLWLLHDHVEKLVLEQYSPLHSTNTLSTFFPSVSVIRPPLDCLLYMYTWQEGIHRMLPSGLPHTAQVLCQQLTLC